MHGVQSVTDLMVRPGIINLDFADVETVMASMGKAMMGPGEADGEGRAMKAADMAINTPLIDDYTLRGAKGLLVNITGGSDLKLFEVDEVVNKIRSEVDSEAEVIIGAITDESLEGKIRVSIVATSLDGQQPEAKSVINMVHRIQNRNPGYSDFTQTNSHQSFNFGSSTPETLTNGANALKLDNEVFAESTNETSTTESFNESVLETQETILENNLEEKIEADGSEEPTQVTNGLENFEIEAETPELFNSKESFDLDKSKEEMSAFENHNDDAEEDDLEIPAFLRRQKN
jgi:cell division protein FtsZ